VFFVLAKLFWFVFEPGNFLVLFLLAGVVLLALRRRAGMWVTFAAATCLFAVLVLPVNRWPARPLEDRFLPPASIARVDGILVLGGGHNDSLVSAADLLRRYKSARLVFSGGNGSLDAEDAPEADKARIVLKQIGIDTGRVTFENRSRNTWENLVFAKALVRPKPGETWLLVTAGRHMPRAIGVAQHIKWNMLPWPYDREDRRHDTAFYDSSLSDKLHDLEDSLHEWVGLVAYRLTGKTDTLFPAPRGAFTSSAAANP
jgi:uncharacterized SAM-binding protein YcdF (DUF218 family)